MNITTGTGRSAWQPRRIVVEAYSSAPPGTPLETLGPEVISGSFTYGCLGGCQGAALRLAEVPPAWLSGGYPRLLRTRLESEHGSGYAHAGILTSPAVRPGELREATLLAPHRVFADVPGSALDNPPLTAGLRLFGYTLATPLPEQTRAEAAADLLANWANAEYGVGPDLYAVLGRPEDAAPASYTVGAEALELQNLGYITTEAVTDAVFDPGEDWQRRWYRRTDAPPFVPRRSAPVRVTRPILDRTQTFTWSGSGWSGTVDSDTPVTLTFGPYSQSYNQNVTVLRNVSLVVECQYRVTSSTPLVLDQPSSPATLDITLRRNGQDIGSVSAPLAASQMGLDLVARFEVATQGDGEDMSGTYSVLYTISPGSNNRTGFRLSAPVGTHVYQTPNYQGVSMPQGWTLPFVVGPSYQFKLPGWHVPPFRVTIPEALCGVPGGLAQYAAGAVVTWNRNEASTLITTAALRPTPPRLRSLLWRPT